MSREIMTHHREMMRATQSNRAHHFTSFLNRATLHNIQALLQMYPCVTCFCGRPIAHLYPAFMAMLAQHRASPRAHEPIGYILDELGLTRECCRARIMTNAEFKHYYNESNPANIVPTIHIMDMVARSQQGRARR